MFANLMGCGCCGAAHDSCFAGIPNCFCTDIPPTLTMTSADPACNYRMFQSCVLQYGPTPAVFAGLNLGDNIFLSTESFPDPTAADSRFYYYLNCSYNQFALSRLYPTSPFGSPYRDSILYTWLVGGYGNTCGTATYRCCLNPAFTAWIACAKAHGFTPIIDDIDPNYHDPGGGPHCNDNYGVTNPIPAGVVAACGSPPPWYTLTPTGSASATFRLDNGSAFPGSDASCSVTIDAV